MAKNQTNQSIVETTVEMEPVAVVFNVQNNEIENFVHNYLTSGRGIEGVAATRVHVIRDGNRNPEVALYAFFDQNSKDIFSNLNKVPQHLRAKMDIGGFRASDKLFNALKPITREFKLSGDTRQNLVYIKLDVFKVLGLMLAAEPRRHQIIVSEIFKYKKGKSSILTVIKSNKFVDRNEDGGFDKFSNIIDRIED